MELKLERDVPKESAFTLKVSHQDRELWRAAATEAGVSMSALIRAATRAAARDLLANAAEVSAGTEG